MSGGCKLRGCVVGPRRVNVCAWACCWVGRQPHSLLLLCACEGRTSLQLVLMADAMDMFELGLTVVAGHFAVVFWPGAMCSGNCFVYREGLLSWLIDFEDFAPAYIWLRL